MKKILAVLGVALGLASAPGFAAPMCSGITSINAWASAGSCDIGDKRFTLINTDLNLNPPFTDHNIGFSTNGVGSYGLVANSGFLGNGIPANDNEFLDYSVQVIGSANVISLIGLDSDISFTNTSAGTTTVTKYIYTDFIGGNLLDTLVSTDGLQAFSDPLNHSILYIRDVLALAPGDFFNSFSNSIDQRTVPEPGMLSLFGVMLAAGGFFGTRRRKS